jgi:thioredoxin-related protein
MKNKITAIIIFQVAILFNAFSQPIQKQETEPTLVWHSNMMEAYQLSKSTNKPIFAFFTGSDWCGWCKKLQKEVFAKPEFITWANENVILVELDFPRNKKLPDDLARQNAELQQVFKVSGYPTIWMFYLTKDEINQRFTIDGLGSLGYPQRPEPGKEEIAFLKTANEILANKKTN